MDTLVSTLINYPVLTLFIVIGIGYWAGELTFRGMRLGVAAVLFVGLAIGSLSPQIALPEIVSSLGLIIFVYCIGIHAGPEFARLFQQRGLRDSGLCLVVLSIAAAFAWLFGKIAGLGAVPIAGLFCGALTNTPALAAVRETLTEVARQQGLSADQINALSSQPVVAYSIAYPVGVLGVLAAFQIFRWVFKIEMPKAEPPIKIINRNLKISNPGVFGKTIGEIARVHTGQNFIVSRIFHEGRLHIAHSDTELLSGDIITVVGEEAAIEFAQQIFGEESEVHLERDRSQFDYRRLYVSSREVVGKKIAELGLKKRFHAVITRLRRGDVDMVPAGDTCLEYGDRVRVVCPIANMEAVTIHFGDSVKSTAQADFGAMGLGMMLGVFVGMIPIGLPGGMTARLGMAGGPLVVALFLGYLRRTGAICWVMPLSANLTLRQIGLLLFLGGVGTRAGYEFVNTFRESGVAMFLSGAAVTFFTAFFTLYVANRRLKIPYDYVMGLMSGIQTQPAALGFATSQSNTDAPDLAYATVYPAATIGKIVIAQLLLAMLGGLVF